MKTLKIEVPKWYEIDKEQSTFALKIEVPEGYEIDKEQSTFEQIVFKEIKNELPKSWEELKIIEGHQVMINSRIEAIFASTADHVENTFKTREQAAASIALAQLSQLREVYRQSYKPDYMDNYTVKYGIYPTNQGLKIGAIEEAAYKMGFIDAEQLKKLAQPLLKSGYGNHLLSLI
jgi:dTDP-glucose pyrophosphorylase